MKGAARCAALLLLLGAAFATIPGRPTVMDVRGGWYRRNAASVSVASASQGQESYSYESYGYEEKEVCLQEVERKACHTHSVDGGCGSGTPGDDCDKAHSFWTSDLACCHDKHDYGYSRGSATVGDHLWGGAHGAIGSCDWTWHYVDDDAGPVANPGGISITNNINKLGSANAVCFFGADSHECGGPFCERLVMSLEGNVYEVFKAYSYWGRSDTTTDNTGCDLASRYIATGAGSPPDATGNTGTGRAMGEGTARPAETAAHADTQYYHDEGSYEKRPVYSGAAVVINGIVNSMAGPRKDKWDSGVFEYVVGFDTSGTAVTSGLDTSLPWVRDKAYKFTFYKQAHAY